jgi:hypothetical protein
MDKKTSIFWQLYQLTQRWNEWWEFKTQQWANNLPDNDLFSWLDSDLIQLFFRVLFWIVLAFILAWIGLKVYHWLQRFYYTNKDKLTLSSQSYTSEQIPRKSVNSWLKNAQYFQQKGNYREAIKCLYMAMLQKLNDTGIAPHQSSRTDGEYLDIIRQLPDFSCYQILLINHQKLLFSKQNATVSMWEECQQAFKIIDNSLEKISP